MSDSPANKVLQACGAYVAASVAVWGVVDLAISAFELPESILRLAMIASCTGLPFAAVAAWRMTRERGHSPGIVGVVAGSVVATSMFALILVFGDGAISQQQERSGASVAAIAILPFENLSDDGANEHFAIGVADDVVTSLQSWGLMPVVGRNATEAYRGKSPDLGDVGRALGVQYLLTGSVRAAGEDIRITAQLVDAQTNEVVRALGPYDRQGRDIFATQDEISKQIVNAIAPEMMRREIQPAPMDRPTDLATWELVMRALGLTMQGEYEAAREAEALLQLAIDREPGYAAAYTRLAEIGHDMSWTGYVSVIGDAAADAYLDEALTHARTAVRLNPALVDARIWYGHLLLHHRQIDAAVVQLEKAVALSPSHGQARAELGFGYALTGDLDAAFHQFGLSSQLSPNDPRSVRIQTFEALTYMYGERFLEAAATAREVIDDNPGSARNNMPYIVEICSLLRLGKGEQARLSAQQFVEDLGDLDWPAIERAAWSEEQLALVKADLEAVGLLP